MYLLRFSGCLSDDFDVSDCRETEVDLSGLGELYLRLRGTITSSSELSSGGFLVRLEGLSEELLDLLRFFLCLLYCFSSPEELFSLSVEDSDDESVELLLSDDDDDDPSSPPPLVLII